MDVNLRKIGRRESMRKNRSDHVEVEAGLKDTEVSGTGRRVVIGSSKIEKETEKEKEKKKERRKLENLIEKAGTFQCF